MGAMSTSTHHARHVVVIGGGPGGYEAALVARRVGAEVTLVERDGLGGAAVLTDVVPSKTLIATAEWMTIADRAADLGVQGLEPPAAGSARRHRVDLGRVNARVMELARAQSADITARLAADGVEVIAGTGRLDGPGRVLVDDGGALDADAVLIATGARPRELPDVRCDGERILDWTQLYQLDELPERLVVVGSGVTGVEFAGAYTALGAEVVLVSSRDRLLPGEDADAAHVLEGVLADRGMTVLPQARAAGARRTEDGVVVELTDGRSIDGSHCLLALGSVPSTTGIGLVEAGVRLGERGHVLVDAVSRTNVPGVYAAGDCTGVLPVASAAALQGRIAMAHALGTAVVPLDLHTVSRTVFTSPEIAAVGASEPELDAGVVVRRIDLSRNPRAKMLGIRDGFVKLFADPVTGTVLGGVVVAPRASELIFPVTVAVAQRMTATDLAGVFTVYPSLSGSITEVARQLGP